MTGQWYEGFRKFAEGRNWTACTTAEQLRGWLAASAGEAACGVLDVAARNGADASQLDAVLSSIEDGRGEGHYNVG